MIRCTFRLNGQGMSTLVCPGIGFFPAFSGYEGVHRNNPDYTNIKDAGPLPTGRYYIVSRPTGGRLGRARDIYNSVKSGSDLKTWYGLFKDDGSIDDKTLIECIDRGEFRLHPAGYWGVSKGCITLQCKSHYAVLRSALLQTASVQLTSELITYGTIQVY